MPSTRLIRDLQADRPPRSLPIPCVPTHDDPPSSVPEHEADPEQPTSLSLASTSSSLATASLHSLLDAFPDAPIPESNPSHIPSFLVDSAAIERSVIREILEMYAGAGRLGEDGGSAVMDEVVRYYLEGSESEDGGSSLEPTRGGCRSSCEHPGSLQLSIPAGLSGSVQPPSAASRSSLSTSWVHVPDIYVPWTLRLPSPIQRAPSANSSNRSATSFGSFQPAPRLSVHRVPSLSPTGTGTPSDPSDAGEDAPLIRHNPGEFIVLDGVDGGQHSPVRSLSSTPSSAAVQEEEDGTACLIQRELTVTRQFVDVPSSQVSLALHLQVDDAVTVIEQLMRTSTSSDAGPHRISSEDERVLDAMSDSAGRDSGHRRARFGGIPQPSESFVQTMGDPLSALTPKELFLDKKVLDFSVIPRNRLLKLKFRVGNYNNSKPVAFYLCHQATNELRQRLRAEYNYIPKHVLERYCKMIRVTPHSGVLQPASSSIVTVQLKLETVDGDFLRLFGPTLSIEVRSLFLQGSSKLRWSTEALRALFRNEHSGRFAATRQTVYFLLPQRVAFTGIPERKESDGTRLVRFRPNEEVNARMRKFCAEDSLLMERIRARRANVPDVKPEVGKQEMLVPEEQEQEKDRTSFLLTVFAVAATILAAFILTTSAEGSEMRSTNY